VIIQAILFDLDGVLVDSQHAVELVWQEWGRQRGRDPAPFIALAHGRRTSETIRMVAPELDAAAEAAVLDRLEEECTEGLRPGTGALNLVRGIPLGRWGVVTSGHRHVATLRLTSVGIPIPPVLITGDQVKKGKPDPEPYREGVKAMGVAPSECVVIEDAAPGVASAKSAGIRVIGVRTPYNHGELGGADMVVDNLSQLSVEVLAGGLKLRA
jgi:mannitol-1-/sugar-/sorbitol-6-phosphatase